jgi:lysophospholipase L1-like esterase
MAWGRWGQTKSARVPGSGRMGTLSNLRWQTIQAWQNAQSTLVHVAGYEYTKWADYSSFGAGYTVMMPQYAFRQDGDVRQFKVNFHSTSNPIGACKFKVFRWNATNSVYDLVAEQAFTPPSAGSDIDVTVTIDPPIAVQMGDIPAVYNGTNCILKTDTKTTTVLSRYLNADVTTSDAFATTTNRAYQFECLTYAPFLAVTGDSIPEGHNGTASWHGGLHTNPAGVAILPSGEPTSEMADQLRGSIGDGMILQYQNLSLGSQTFAWVASNGIVECLVVKPHTVLIHCGVNDVAGGRTWEQVEADLNTILTAVNAANPKPRVLIDEIFPWTAGSDANAAILRTFNANLATFASANGWTLVRCHDAMAQTRVSTGELDDYKTGYGAADNVHLSATGVLAWRDILKTYL